MVSHVVKKLVILNMGFLWKSAVNKTICNVAINFVGKNVINHTALLHSTAWKPGGVCAAVISPM